MAQLKDLIVNGPSRFIGDVYATTFTGDLNGNANTATSATTAAALTGKTLVTASAVTTSNWPTYKDNHIPTMSFMTYWNGAYSGTSSNLTYCAQGAIIGSNNIGNQSVKYATTSGSCNGNAATAGSATNADKLDGYHASSFSLTSHTHSYIVTQGDNRSVATTPNDYNNRITFAGLKNNSTIGNPSSTTYNYVIGLRGWSDTSGGKAHELAFSDNGIFHRIGDTDTWESWAMMLTTSNYNSYVPSLTGSGASGTWGINISGNAATATTAVKIGTSTVGSTTMPVYINSGTPTAITSFPESYLSWGGLPIEGDISPIDAACCDEFGHNKLAFLPADCITVEYTTDGGSTWIDYGASDVQKTSLVTSNTAFYIGKGAASAIDGTMTNSNCSNYQVRVTVSSINSSGTHKIYTTSKKLLINISSNGSSGCKIKMETQTIGDYNNNVDTWTTINIYNVSGYSGWNSIPLYFPAGNTFGGFEGQTSKVAKLRLTLSITGVEDYTSQASILGLRLIGTSSWINPSIMSETGHLYSYDAYQNAEFPAAVKATNFRISGGTSSQFLKADGSIDSNTYSKSSHTHTSVLDVGGSATTFAYSKAGLSYGDYTYLAGWNGYELRAINKSQFAQASHSHTGSEVKLTGYSKASSYSAIAASDTVNQAIGKLERAISGLENLLASI